MSGHGRTGPEERRGGFRVLFGVVAGERRSIIGAVLLTLVTSALAMAQPLAVKQAIDAAHSGSVPWAILVLLGGLFAGHAVGGTAVRYVLGRTAETVALGVRLRLIHHLMRLHMPAYDRYRTGDLISRASADAALLRRVVAEGTIDAVAGAVGVIGTMALMIWLDWVLFLVVMVLVIVGGSLVGLVLPGTRRASLRGQHAIGAMSSDLERALGGIRTVRASQAEDRETERISRQARSAYAAGVRLARLEAAIGPASSLAIDGSFLIVLLIGGLRVADGSSSVSEFVAFALYMTYLVGPVGSVFQAMSSVQQGVGALQRIEEVLALPQEPAASGKSRPHGPADADRSFPARPAAAVLEFRDVCFGYEPDRPVVRNVSFRVPARGRVALVGPSGAGKSTIFALAERFYDPDLGQVLFGGSDVRTLDHREYRTGIGLVEQHSPVLYGTLRENLVYVAPDAADDEIRHVLELANLSDWVAQLPHGLDTEVGERGVVLSGGQRQRVAVARALLTKPSLLLLDEPTSHLDAVNESALDRAIEEVSRECALLVIAHRFSTVRTADQIIVLDQGEIAGVGTHEELKYTNGYYRQLAEGALHRTDLSGDRAN